MSQEQENALRRRVRRKAGDVSAHLNECRSQLEDGNLDEAVNASDAAEAVCAEISRALLDFWPKES